jgi:hypothetical protein
MVLWGHGKRWRLVVMPGARALRVWTWRFLCQRCGCTCSVSPDDVLARHRYALSAILTAWFLGVARPIGDAKADEEVYALVGVDRRLPGPEAMRSGCARWRSLGRWAARIEAWWPARAVVGSSWRQRATSLLSGFLPGDGERGAAIRRAVAAHTAGGTAM